MSLRLGQPGKTREQILVYTLLLLPVSLLPSALGFTGPIYGVAAIAAGVHMIALAWRLRTDGRTGERARTIHYLFSYYHLPHCGLQRGSGPGLRSKEREQEANLLTISARRFAAEAGDNGSAQSRPECP
jgi:hypothetical protein